MRCETGPMRILALIEMQARGGIRELYNPFTGEGYGATDFGWSCLSLDLIAAENVI